MPKNWIVLGDPTSGGGRVLTGSPFTDIDGMPVARVSDQASCPTHKGVFPIVDGDPTLIVDGHPIALHGSSLACGCKVLSAQQIRVLIDDGGEAAQNSSLMRQAVSANMSDAASRVQFDEAIRFVNAGGAALAGVPYTLFLESGRTVDGKTDDDGKTGRVTTDAPEDLIKAELRPGFAPCCPMHAERTGSEPEVMAVGLEGVTTSSAGVGASIRQITTSKGEVRGLTPGEIEMSRLVFGHSIQYDLVKVHNGEYLWFGMQPDDTAMTPNGELYFNPKHFQEDFSNPADIVAQQWFMHEMVHVWQFQLGYPVKWRGAVRIGLSYKYTLHDDKRLGDYNMEAQGNILADYFVLKHRGRQLEMYEDKYWYDPNALALFESVLVDFLSDPGNTDNLP